MRQPQLRSWSSGRVETRIAQMAEAARVPELVPRQTREEMRPRRRAGANSASITVAPAISAPAPKPWARRKATSMMGAQMPIIA